MKNDGTSQEPDRVKGPTDWVSIKHVERDICLCFHELAEYGAIIGDLDYGRVYGLDYWQYLDVDGWGDVEREQFIRNGCLVLILAMCWDEIDGSGTYIAPRIPECRDAIRSIAPEDPVGSRLREIVLRALDGAEVGKEPEGLLKDSGWVYKAVVNEYFRTRIHHHETKP